MTFFWPWLTVFLNKCLSPQRWHSIQSTGVRSQFRDFSKIRIFKNHKKSFNLFFNFYFSKKSNQSSNIRLCHLIGCWRNRTWLVNLIFERKRLKYRPIRCQDFFSVKWLLRIGSWRQLIFELIEDREKSSLKVRHGKKFAKWKTGERKKFVKWSSTDGSRCERKFEHIQFIVFELGRGNPGWLIISGKIINFL